MEMRIATSLIMISHQLTHLVSVVVTIVSRMSLSFGSCGPSGPVTSNFSWPEYNLSGSDKNNFIVYLDFGIF